MGLININGNIIQIAFPELISDLTYNGGEQSPQFYNYFSTYLDISGTASAIDAGEYIITFTPKKFNDKIVVWENNTIEPYNITWKINKKIIDILPVVADSIYTGYKQKPIIYNTDEVNIDKISKINVDNHIIKYYPKDNYKFNDNDEYKELVWNILPKPIDKPIVINIEKTYNTFIQEPDINSIDTEYIDISGDLSADKVGSYSIVFSLKNKNNTYWADSKNTDDYIINWSINKANNILSVNKDNIIINNNIQQIELSYSGNGNIHIENNEYVKVTIDNNILYIQGIKEGSAILSSYIEEDDNYLQSNIIRININILPVINKLFKDNNLEQIQYAIRHNLISNWNIGDSLILELKDNSIAYAFIVNINPFILCISQSITKMFSEDITNLLPDDWADKTSLFDKDNILGSSAYKYFQINLFNIDTNLKIADGYINSDKEYIKTINNGSCEFIYKVIL